MSLDGWICQYETNGAIIDTGLVYGNRNGHYRRFEARRKGPLAVKVTLIRASFPLSLPTSDVTDWPQGIFHGAAPRSFLHFANLRQAEEGAAATGQIQPPVL